MARHQCFALALLPAVAVGGGAGPLELAVVASVTCAGTLSTAAQGLGEATGRTLEDILVDVLRPGPGEAARVIAANHVQRRGVGVSVSWKYHRHQGRLLRLWVVRGVSTNS